MLLEVKNLNKSIGPKVLFNDMSFSLYEGEKMAMIGRNGVGKTTLFKVLSGEDGDYLGSINYKKGIRIVMTSQEHFLDQSVSPLSYILDHVPRYHELKNIIKTYPDIMGNDMKKISEYSEAVNLFSELGYYEIEDKIISSLESLMIPFEKALGEMRTLSGGEKRFVELAKVMFSEADIALVDEPTNHMDYVGKNVFLEWLESFPKSVLVISHDRDVLEKVDKILEVKDKNMVSFKGNYTSYLKQNSLKTVTQVKDYEDSLKQLERLHEQWLTARVKKLSAKSDSGRKRAKIMEERFFNEYTTLKESLEKPSFWVDEKSKENLHESFKDSYEKYKDKNINIKIHSKDEYRSELIRLENLSLGYTHPLFQNISFILSHGDRIMLKGRNGVGKSTLVKSIIQKYKNEEADSKLFNGDIIISPKLRLGIYEQEIDHKYLNMALYDGLAEMYNDLRIEKSRQDIFNEMASFLFNPMQDGDILIRNLSGGQKARFQIMKMLAGKPNLLILDEPTNHLDLPSIEELEKVLTDYTGAVLYITHDTFFMRHMGGRIIPVGLQ